jgi:hypothetical protein
MLFALYVVSVAGTSATVEVQIEGPNGWAMGLPTWHVENRWTRFFLGDRPLSAT